jgi:probable HAF family extracellular repeat protein
VAFLLDGSGMSPLGTLGGDSSGANAVNESGEVVGWSETPPVNGFEQTHAFVWRRGVMHELGTIAGGYSYASDIDARGDIVGTSMVPIPGQRAATIATLWRNERVLNLNDLVANLDGWSLNDATAINKAGRILVMAHRAGEERIAVLEPVNP